MALEVKRGLQFSFAQCIIQCEKKKSALFIRSVFGVLMN